ncbi:MULTISPECIES: phage portal protein [unclassified Sporosarcina]|uniref:phage portal protein n=1 Tax=unclassified Sporosarcina TaxID=2647733 RepID=UPI00203E425F|nr:MULTISPECIES: phage portal protein [unclassified Sporosarcina]GKV64092.1 hypothetical protein NCCP2331_02450 [Sporosarcina sp. NCCP-2331]GLB54443.1 hypothetical protein NCCP2378_02280 [Sporosarcina sp. NCCP-2378]
MNLKEYVKVKHNNKSDWFLQEVNSVSNAQKIMKVKANKDYLDGNHDILQRPPFYHNGVLVEPRKIVINLARQLINWQTSFLLRHDVVVVGQQRVADELNEVSKRAKFNLKNTEILKKLLCYGQCAEYIYLDKGRITSKIIDPSQYTPIYNRHNELIGLVEFYSWNGRDYYTVYDEEKVQEYESVKGRLQLTAQYASLTGLPVIYSSNDLIGNSEGRSDLEDWKGILDNIEDLLSKYTDSFYSYLNPIPVVSGQQLKGGMDKNQVSQGLILDDGASFSLVTGKMDSNTFNSLYKTLFDTLMQVSATPSVAFGDSQISNVSEQTVKLLFSLSEVKANQNESHLKHGFNKRMSKVRELLTYRGFTMTDDEFYSVDFTFTYNIPMNEGEIISNMQKLREMSGISIDTLLENNPYVQDVEMEKQRLQNESVNTMGNREDTLA